MALALKLLNIAFIPDLQLLIYLTLMRHRFFYFRKRSSLGKNYVLQTVVSKTLRLAPLHNPQISLSCVS
jgi:hypothetical protein